MLSATLKVGGNTSNTLERACGSRKVGVRLVKWLENGQLNPLFSLVFCSGKIRVRVDERVSGVTIYVRGEEQVVRCNYEDGSYVELSGFDGWDREAAKWLEACKHAVACAVCNTFEPIRDKEKNYCRINEQLLCRAISKLGVLVSAEDPFLAQAKFLLKSRQTLTEILTRLQNGGIDFISIKELDHLYKGIKQRRDPYLMQDSDVTLLETLRTAASKLRNSRAGSAVYVDAMKDIDAVVTSLQQYPIHVLEGEESDGSSSSSACDTPLKVDEFADYDVEEKVLELERELESGREVFVEAASVTICHALPSSKGGKNLDDHAKETKEPQGEKKDQEPLPTAITSPSKTSKSAVIVATPVGRKGKAIRSSTASLGSVREKFSFAPTGNKKEKEKNGGRENWMWVHMKQVCFALAMGALLALAALSPSQGDTHLSIERPQPSVETMKIHKAAVISILPSTLHVKYSPPVQTRPSWQTHLVEGGRSLTRKVHRLAVCARLEQRRKSRALSHVMIRHAMIELIELIERASHAIDVN